LKESIGFIKALAVTLKMVAGVISFANESRYLQCAARKAVIIKDNSEEDEMKRTLLTALFTVVLSVTAFAEHGEGPRDVADRLRGDAERADNRGDYERGHEARQAAERAEGRSAAEARDIERSYNRGDGGNRNSGANREPGNQKL
jgi:hypothetical protein